MPIKYHSGKLSAYVMSFMAQIDSSSYLFFHYILFQTACFSLSKCLCDVFVTIVIYFINVYLIVSVQNDVQIWI